MKSPYKHAYSTPSSSPPWLSRLPQRGLASLLCAALILPGVLQAEEVTVGELKPSAHLALHQASPSSEIRLKLHSLEKRDAQENEKASESSDVELKKQAQARYLAEKFRQQEKTVRKYVDLAWAEAEKRGSLEPELLIAIMQKESAFRPKVQSRYGAQGLMQVVPRWHREKLRPSESLFDPEVNIRVGADVLEEYLALADGNLNHALRKYSGNSRNYVNTVLKESRTLARIADQAARTPAQG